MLMNIPATATMPEQNDLLLVNRAVCSGIPGARIQYMTLSNLYETNSFVLSFELYPPKNESGREDLSENLRKLLTFNPQYVTCTYGAGGSTREGTLSTLALVRELSDVPVASHLTCVGSTVEELREYLAGALEQGIDYIVAIRGDAPKGEDTFKATDGGLNYASDLVQLIRAEFPRFGIVVGGYPETHPEATSADRDLDYLKQKVDTGADVVTTQLFFDNDDFFRFRDRCVATGINVPIVPGLLPVTSYPQIKRITTMCGATLPEKLARSLQVYDNDPGGQYRVGVDHARRQASELVKAGVPGIHFYVLNQSKATTTVLHGLPLS